MAEQIPFDFSTTRFSAQDFEVGACNTDAVKIVRGWPNWPAPILALFGPSGVGKTHLGHIWAHDSDAFKLSGLNVTRDMVETGKPLFLDEASNTPESLLFMILNLALNGDIPGLLLVDRQAPRLWAKDLPDVRSRLRNVPTVELADHDDALLEPIIRKLFTDQGRDVSADIVHFMMKQCNRSIDHMRHLVAELDLAARQNNADLTKRFVAQFLKRRVGG